MTAPTTFFIANTRARAHIAKLRAADMRREVAIYQHSTQQWLDTFAIASMVYTSEILHDNYLKTARSFARREMHAIDAMHAALNDGEGV